MSAKNSDKHTDKFSRLEYWTIRVSAYILLLFALISVLFEEGCKVFGKVAQILGHGS